MEIITRDAAHAQNKRFYYTGDPCKHGHDAQRYVSTGGCSECLKKFRPRLHPTSKDLVPYDGAKLWRSRRLSPEQLGALTSYLQSACDTFCAHVLPPVCQTCHGTHYVPSGAAGGGDWIICPDCPDDTGSAP